MKREGAWQKKWERERGDRVQRCWGSPPHCYTVLYSSRLSLPLVLLLLLPPAFPDLSLSDEAGAGRGAKGDLTPSPEKAIFCLFVRRGRGGGGGREMAAPIAAENGKPHSGSLPWPCLAWLAGQCQPALTCNQRFPPSPGRQSHLLTRFPPNPSSGFPLLSAGWILYRAGG